MKNPFDFGSGMCCRDDSTSTTRRQFIAWLLRTTLQQHDGSMRNNGRVPFVTISFAVPFAILHSCSADGIPQLEFYAHFDLISKLFLLSLAQR